MLRVVGYIHAYALFPLISFHNLEDIQAFPAISMQCDVIRQETRQDFICTHF